MKGSGIKISRIIWIVLDSVGMGELPDAGRFGDKGCNTLGNIAKQKNPVLPNLCRLGLGNIDGMVNIPGTGQSLGAFGRLAEISDGKDTTTGHWEMVGIYSQNPFPTYPDGFPKEITDAFVKAANVEGILGNCAASGTEIIKRLGTEHVKTGFPIVYTSADSVFQIACHEEIYSVSRLYEMCAAAREVLQGEHAVARVIARPFTGRDGAYERTANRRDFSLKPPKDNLLERMKQSGLDVKAVGKIEDIFAGEGITETVHTKDNMDGVKKTLEYMKQGGKGLIFTNLVEFDMKWGHRNDADGYAKGLEEFDQALPEILNAMNEDDLLIITADHGCDPTTEGTDHTREYVPLLLYGSQVRANVNLGTGRTFADIGQTAAEIFGLKPLVIGESFLSKLV